jgi:ADP-L-glycero-D-manno-heptose 6-epimerase
MIWFYQNPKIKGIFNLGTGHAQSWNELAEAVFKACGKPKSIEYVDMPDPLKGQYQYFTEADLTKLRASGCPTKFRNLEKAVKDYVQNHLLRKDPCL